MTTMWRFIYGLAALVTPFGFYVALYVPAEMNMFLQVAMWSICITTSIRWIRFSLTGEYE